MIETRFIAKPYKQGNSSVVTIPKAIYNMLKDKEYEFVIKEKSGETNGDQSERD